ncbi:MAG TPA: hypothetical protein VFU11_09540 [Solirubrobacterales bacterium]|nr:hypothetical protein [Solirubrobacterales bacterium]
MKRFKCGLLLMLVLAFGVANASTAAAVQFHSEAETTKITGSQTTTAKYTSTAGEITCEKATYTGTVVGKTVSSVRLAGTVSGCHIIIFGSTISATVSQNGCEGIAYANGEGEMVCPEGKNVVVTASGCTITIPPQKNMGAKYTNVENHISVSGSASGISYSHSGFTCGTGSGTNGTISGSSTAKGTNTAGVPVRIWVE